MSKNPIDGLDEYTEKVAVARDVADMAAFTSWKQNPNQQTTGVLLQRFNSEFGKRTSVWKARGVNEAAFKADLKKNAIHAFETFDPDRGAQLRTHVNNMLRRSQRFNARYQNLAFIPEEKQALITPVKQAIDFLHQETGSKPTNAEVAKHLSYNEHLLPKRVRGKMNEKLVATVQSYQIKDIPGSAFESDPTPKAMSFERETLDLLRPALTGDEQTVFDYMFGRNGKPKMESTGAIAIAMGKSPPQISRLKKRIEATYTKYST